MSKKKKKEAPSDIFKKDYLLQIRAGLRKEGKKSG